MVRAERRRIEERARLQAGVFAHHGVEATSAPLVPAWPPLTTRVVRVGSGPPTIRGTQRMLAARRPPVLMLWGEHDEVQSPEAGRWAAGLLPHGRFEVLPGGHALWFALPERCGRLVTEFLHEADQQPA